MNENLAAFSALYEMEVAEQEWPWENASNLVLPIIPAELDAMLAYIAAQVFVQRLVIVTPGDNDPETARLAPQVERFYNAELRRIRSDGKTPIEHFLNVLHLGLRDGGAPLDVVFSERTEPKLVTTDEPDLDDEGNVLFDESGAIKTREHVQRIEETVREVSVEPSLLKEWYLVPDESVNIKTALGNAKVVWMTEKEMQKRVKEGVFYEDAVERILQRCTAGQTDVASDPQGAYDKDAGGQINVGQGQGAIVSEFFKNRGPARLVRLFSEQFDLNDDGIAEKNVFWFSPEYSELVGWHEYEYVDGSWPSFMFAPFPRPDRPYGYSLVERLADIVAEANAGRNQRRNYIDLCLMPILLRREGDSIIDKDRAFYPGADWSVEDTERSLKWFVPPALSPDAFSDEARLDVYVSKLSGQNAPAVGAQSSGRRSATESRQQQLAQTVRANLVAMLFRSFLRAVMQFWHKLNKQYLGAQNLSASTVLADGSTLTLSPEVMKRNFNLDISGLSDPLDAPSRRQEFIGALQVVAKVFPWIIGDPEKSYALAEAFFDTFNLDGATRFIGTPEEAQERKKAMAQAAQAQAAMTQQAQAGGHPGSAQNGKVVGRSPSPGQQ